jgi:hypothetical protein
MGARVSAAPVSAAARKPRREGERRAGVSPLWALQGEVTRDIVVALT